MCGTAGNLTSRVEVSNGRMAKTNADPISEDRRPVRRPYQPNPALSPGVHVMQVSKWLVHTSFALILDMYCDYGPDTDGGGKPVDW